MSGINSHATAGDIFDNLHTATNVLDLIANGLVTYETGRELARGALRTIGHGHGHHNGHGPKEQVAAVLDTALATTNLELATETLRSIARGCTDEAVRRLAANVLEVIDGVDVARLADESAEALPAREYKTAAERDLAAMEHSLAALAESLELKRPCECDPSSETYCLMCEVLESFENAIGDARQLLLGGEEPEEAA